MIRVIRTRTRVTQERGLRCKTSGGAPTLAGAAGLPDLESECLLKYRALGASFFHPSLGPGIIT